MSWLTRLLRRSAPLPEPALDHSVAQRLAAAGKDPARVQAQPAEPLEIPARPLLPGFTGTVSLELTLDATGRVAEVRLEGGPPEAAAELTAWARAWRFSPARLEGQAHPCRMVFQVAWP
ncbi:energy transducer TonB [Geothrix rubra]|nr:energy transducer TonB [Geothrix rubra]